MMIQITPEVTLDGIADQTLVLLPFRLDCQKCRYRLMGSETHHGVANSETHHGVARLRQFDKWDPVSPNN